MRIAQLGIGRKFQRPTVFQGHTVYENCELALKGNKGVFHALFARLTAAERTRIEEILELIGLKDHAKRQAGLLAHGQKQWLEIGMLLAQSPSVLLVDEPIAGMTHAETERTAELLRSLAGDAHGRRGRARHGVRAQHRPEGDGAAPGEGPGRRADGADPEGPARHRGLPRGMSGD